jgi:GNAT superfamily N-acetyltransferase
MTINPVFTRADPVTHREALLDICVEYMEWVAAGIEEHFKLSVPEMLGMPVAAYTASTLDKACGDAPPRGVFYLVEHDGAVAAIGGLRRVREGVSELKRVYVRPAHRGKHLAQTLIQRILGDARGFGYRKVILDTGPFMTAAQRLYEANGFVDCAVYPEAETPEILHSRWRFMERAL